MTIDLCIINCLMCDAELLNFNKDDNHPMGGVEFTTPGHYGSTIFDPCDGTQLAINICDGCLQKAIDNKKVLKFKVKRMPSRRDGLSHM
jgi:hypothetical protein